jgi:hypothetical protein
MPTPLTPDEEFDAHFRRGLEHYPGLPEGPDDWRRMESLLDAELPAQPPHYLRRYVLRLLGGGVLVLALLAGLGWHNQHSLRSWVARHTQPAKPSTPLAARSPALGINQGTNQVSNPRATSFAARSVEAAQPTTLAANSEATSTLPELPETTTTRRAPRTKASSTERSGALALATAPTGSGPTRAPRISSGSNLPARPAVPPSGQAVPKGKRRVIGWLPGSLARRHHWQPGSKRYLAATAAGTMLSKSATPSATREQANYRIKTRAATLAPLAHHLPGKAQWAGGTSDRTRVIALSEKHQRRARRAGSVRPAEGAVAPILASPYHLASRRSNTPHSEQYGSEGLVSQPLAGANARQQAVDALAGTGLLHLRPDTLPAVVLQLARVTAFDSLPTPKPLAFNTYRLHLGLLASPELNTVHRSPAGLGGSVGLQVEYQLARRWRLSTGYLQAIKRYEATGSDYQLVPTWPSSWVLSGVTANCRIIDVPLNLRYDVWQQPLRRAFVSGGLSSLFMRREDYDYQYEVAGQTKNTAWQLLNGSSHPFQVLNLSVGYEQNINSRWALQAEPYLKLPLGGIGYGAVRLQSAGIFFSLKYSLLRAAAGR